MRQNSLFNSRHWRCRGELFPGRLSNPLISVGFGLLLLNLTAALDWPATEAPCFSTSWIAAFILPPVSIHWSTISTLIPGETHTINHTQHLFSLSTRHIFLITKMQIWFWATFRIMNRWTKQTINHLLYFINVWLKAASLFQRSQHGRSLHSYHPPPMVLHFTEQVLE